MDAYWDEYADPVAPAGKHVDQQLDSSNKASGEKVLHSTNETKLRVAGDDDSDVEQDGASMEEPTTPSTREYISKHFIRSLYIISQNL
jgi:hypothetical protein